MKKKDTTTGTRCNQQAREVMKMRKPPKSNEYRENEKDAPKIRCLQIVR
jgi:hypothetical protein